MYCIVVGVFLISFTRNVDTRLRIIGGKDADEHKYPYIVRLQHQFPILGLDTVGHIHVCTCAVIPSTWTLTAAHCLEYPENPHNVELKPVIRYGPLEDMWSKKTISEVLLSIKHPGYRYGSLVFNINNDIGLLKSKAITLNEYARVSALDFVTLVGQEVILVGYGITNSTKGFIDDATEAGKPLQMLDVIVVQCDKKNVDMTPAVCVASRCGQTSGICKGDSGGPMLHPSGVVGINSLGSKNFEKFCSLKLKIPNYDVAVITPISPYVDWISDVINMDTT